MAANNPGTGDSGFFTFRPAGGVGGTQINVASGNALVRTRDLADGPLTYHVVVDRFYNSLDPDSYTILSPRWGFDVGPDTKLIVESNQDATVRGPSGYRIRFAREADGSYVAPEGFDGALVKTPSGWTLSRTSQNDEFGFDGSGTLAWTKDAELRDFTVQGTSAAGRTVLSSYGTNSGRRVNLSYTTSGDYFVRLMDDPASGHHYYRYSSGRLSEYESPTGAITSYGYDANGFLDEIVEPGGTTVELDVLSSGKVNAITTTLPGGVPQTTSFVYTRRTYKSDVTAPDTTRRTYAYDDDWRVTRHYNPDEKPVVSATGELRDAAGTFVEGDGPQPVTLAAEEPDGAGITTISLEDDEVGTIETISPPCVDTPFDHICPKTFSDDIAPSLSSLPEGLRSLHARAVDDENNVGVSASWEVGVDRTDPIVALGGDLYDARETTIGLGESRSLTVAATDGDAAGGPNAYRSGVQRIEVYLDGELVQVTDQTATGWNAALGTTWTPPTGELESGAHTVEIDVYDRLGHLTSKQFTVLGTCCARELPASTISRSNEEHAFGDVDGDGVSDLVSVSRATGGVRVNLGAGDGEFAGSQSFGSVGEAITAVAVGDFDDDGYGDLVVRTAAGRARVLLADPGEERLLPAGDQPPDDVAWPSDRTVLSADVTGDGRDDLIGRSAGSGSVVVAPARNNGLGASTSWALGTSANRTYHLGDMNSDGRTDLVAYDPLTGGLWWRRSLGSDFADPALWGTVASESDIAVGDFNGDGTPDVLARGSDAAVRGFVGSNAGGVLGQPLDFGALASTFTLLAVDVTGDGRADSLGVSEGSASLTVVGSESIAPDPDQDGIPGEDEDTPPLLRVAAGGTASSVSGERLANWEKGIERVAGRDEEIPSPPYPDRGCARSERNLKECFARVRAWQTNLGQVLSSRRLSKSDLRSLPAPPQGRSDLSAPMEAIVQAIRDQFAITVEAAVNPSRVVEAAVSFEAPQQVTDVAETAAAAAAEGVSTVATSFAGASSTVSGGMKLHEPARGRSTVPSVTAISQRLAPVYASQEKVADAILAGLVGEQRWKLQRRGGAPRNTIGDFAGYKRALRAKAPVIASATMDVPVGELLDVVREDRHDVLAVSMRLEDDAEVVATPPVDALMRLGNDAERNFSNSKVTTSTAAAQGPYIPPASRYAPSRYTLGSRGAGIGAKGLYFEATWTRARSREYFRTAAHRQRGIELEGFPAEGDKWSDGYTGDGQGGRSDKYCLTFFAGGRDGCGEWASNLPRAYLDDITSDNTVVGGQGRPIFAVGSGDARAIANRRKYVAYWQTNQGPNAGGDVTFQANATVRESGNRYCRLTPLVGNGKDRACYFGRGAGMVVERLPLGKQAAYSCSWEPRSCKRLWYKTMPSP